MQTADSLGETEELMGVGGSSWNKQSSCLLGQESHGIRKTG